MADQRYAPPEQLRELEERVRFLEDELRVRDAFIISAAHELRNPVSPLALHVQRLQNAARAATSDQVSARWLGDQLDLFARRLARFMSALNRILDVSRMRSGSIELLLEPVDMVEVTREVIAGFERELAASRSTLRFCEQGPLVGRWDRMRLEQIVSNLVSNAIRYGQSNPIDVSVRPEGELAVLVVEDRGSGIEDADRVRIFERFERADVTHRGGFGVGLWIVRQLCLAMGGAITLASRTGEGSVFTVTLPRRVHGSGDGR